MCKEDPKLKCEICQQQEATVHLTNFLNGHKTEAHLCQQCAKEKGYFDADEDSYTIHDLLSGLFNFNTSPTPNTQSHGRVEQQLICPQCQMTYHQFSKTGKFGCSKCYQTFSDYLNPVFKRVHGGNTVHNGKIPKRQYVHLQHQRLIQDYRTQLQVLVNEERFEEAADLRDKIKQLEKDWESSDQKGDDR